MAIIQLMGPVRQQIEKAVDYGRRNIYSMDELLDMKNKQKPIPGDDPNHSVMVGFGLWVCYYLVDHPNHGLSHYFSFTEGAGKRLPTKEEIEYIMKEFGVETTSVEKYATKDNQHSLVQVRIPDRSLL